MKQSDLFGLLEISDVHDIPKAINEKLFSDAQNRNEFFDSLIKLNNYDMSFDWFQGIFESEMAQRNQNKAKLKNNHLGLKNCRFKSLQTATDFFGKLLTKNPVYSGLKGCQEYREYCFVLSWSGYNKEKDYAPHLIGVIENLGLRQYIENSKSVACN